MPDENSPMGYMMSPTTDLTPVAEAGKRTGEIYFAMLYNPASVDGAILYLASALGANVGQGGQFDFQREGNFVTGFTQLRQFRTVSDFNVGLFCQQAGLSLDETLTTAGQFAGLESSNAQPDRPYGLDKITHDFIVEGFRTGSSGLFGEAAKPPK